MRDRAAQFSPFAALTGYDAAIEETARLTDAKRELDEETKNNLNITISKLEEIKESHPEITVGYFVADERKQGGKYEEMTALFKSTDFYKRTLNFTSGEKIPLDDIAEITINTD